MEPSQAPQFVLPPAVVGLVDVGRIVREVERLDDSLRSQAIRDAADAVQLPKMSLLLEQVLEQNKFDITQATDRQRLLEFLKSVKAKAPRLHMSFSADPSPQFMMKLMLWLRTNVHPHVLLAVGLQPGIGAGCVLRTTNKYFDLSLSKSFADKRPLLMERLRSKEGAPA